MKYEQMMIPGIATRTATSIPTQAAKLRERLQAERCFDSFTADDILTTLIGFTNSTDKAPRIAEALLNSFGSLKGVLEARPEQLRSVSGVGDKTAALISAVVPMVRVWNREAMATPNRIANSRDAEK